MPKKKHGSRPPANHDPRKGPKTNRAKPGSRSPGHRGHRPEEAPQKKRRWNAADRAARDDRQARRGRADDGRRPGAERDGGGSAREGRPGARRGSAPRGAGGPAPRGSRRDFRHDARPEREGFREGRGHGREFREERRPARGGRDDRRPQRDLRDDRRSGRGHRDDRRSGRDFRDDRRSGRDDDRQGARAEDRRPQEAGDRRPPRRDGGRADGHRPDAREGRRHERHAPRDSRPPRAERGHRDARPPRTERAAAPERSVHEPVEDVVLERLTAQAISADAAEGVGFDELGLGGNIVRALAGLGAERPFPIQAATIPPVLEGRDVLGRGRTGSGKTIAFAAPLVERLMRQWAERGKSGGKRRMGRAPRALVLAPTRELALQIDRTVQPIARSVGLFTTQIYGGVPQGRQVGALQRGVDIVIGTPGRIEDLVAQGRLDLSQVEITVLDEADHMCDLGFLEPVQRILRLTAEGGQRLLFSATLDAAVARLVEEFLTEPSVHEVAGEDQESGTIEHLVLVIDQRDKFAVLERLASRDGRTLVFARTRAFTEMIAERLEDAGVRAVSLHGDLSQSRRARNLKRLADGRVDVLVATDVAARGIHVDDIDLVVQADAPEEYKSYLHRSGRTGRAGRPGTVVTLVPRRRLRSVDALLERAEIVAEHLDARPGDALLDAIADGTPR